MPDTPPDQPSNSPGAGPDAELDESPPGAPAHVLVVEDEQHLAVGIERNLRAEGYEVTVVADGQLALEALLARYFDLVVLDVMLPHKNGFEVCEQARAGGFAAPILFLSARASPSERTEGLRLGADDYLGKPFYLAEFLGRVKALLRRSRPKVRGRAGQGPLSWPPTGAVVDFALAEIRFAGGRSAALGLREAAVLRQLWRKRGEVVSREDLLEAAWGQDVMPSSRVLDAIVVGWRQHLEPDPDRPVWLETIRGIGYRLRAPQVP